MKKVLILLGCCLFILSSCKKEPVLIADSPIALIDYQNDQEIILDALPTKDEKKVLLQEFTGVYCYTCPLAHEIVAELIEENPSRIAAMNIHSHLFSIYDDPNVMGNEQDLRTIDSDSIVNMLGGVISLPSAAFDMTTQSGEEKILSYNREYWSGYYDNQLSQESPFNIEVAARITSDEIKTVIKVSPTEVISEAYSYSIAIIESNIIDKQFVDTAVVDDYIHMYVLRDLVTENARGELLEGNLSPGIAQVRVHHSEVGELWNNENLSVIAYIHKTGDEFDVVQVEEIPLYQ